MTGIRSRGRWPLALALGLLALGAPAAWADDACYGAKQKRQLIIKRFRGDPYRGTNNRPHTFEASGNPHHISRLAIPGVTPNEGGYYVGGGCTFQGGPPGPADGTFGLDYLFFRKYHYRVALKWCHKYKGGYGAYDIDGPPVYDIGPLLNEAREGPARRFKGPEHGHENGHNGEGH